MAYIEKKKGRGGRLCYRIQVRSGQHKWSETFYPTTTKPAQIRAEVMREADRFEREMVSGKIDVPSLNEYIARHWKQAARATLTPQQYEQYMQNLSRVICPFLGRYTLDRITPREAQALVDQMAADGLKTSTIRKYMRSLRSVLRHAIDMEVIQDDPCKKIRYPRQEQDQRTHAWTPEQCQSFLQFVRTGYDRMDRTGRRFHEVPDFKWFVFFTLSIYGSFRRGEIVALQWKDIDFDNHTITIQRAAQKIKGSVYVKAPKTAAGIRTVTMPACVFDAIAMLPRKGEFVFTQGGTVSPDAMIYPTSPTKTFNVLLHAYNCANPDDQLPRITLHDLRHTGATILLESGVGIETVSRRLGHSKASVTLDIYGEAMEKTDKTAAEKLDQLLTHKTEEE